MNRNAMDREMSEISMEAMTKMPSPSTELCSSLFGNCRFHRLG